VPGSNTEKVAFYVTEIMGMKFLQAEENSK
jgi:hypothetical protein